MQDSAKNESPNSPGVKFPPPVAYAGGLLAGWLLNLWRPIFDKPWPAREVAGALLTGAGVMLALSAVFLFRRLRTSVMPIRPANRLVTTGPYRFTRNPMYTALTAVYLGIAVLMQSAWALLLLPFVILLIDRKVIRPEEAYLERRFGPEYLRYREQVRRWI